MKPPLAIAGFLAAALHACILFGPSSRQPARPLPVAAESLEVALTAAPEEPVAVPETPPEPPPEPDLPLPEPAPEPVPAAPPEPAPLPLPEPARKIVEPPKPQTPTVNPPKRKSTPAPPKSATSKLAGSPAGVAKTPVKNAGPASSKVRVRSNPAPAYPVAARQARQEGTVTVDVEVSTTGLPLNVRLARSSGFPALDQAALAAVRRWKFEPARAAGVAVNGHVIVPLRFELK